MSTRVFHYTGKRTQRQGRILGAYQVDLGGVAGSEDYAGGVAEEIPLLDGSQSVGASGNTVQSIFAIFISEGMLVGFSLTIE